jgi:uncharacterized protein
VKRLVRILLALGATMAVLLPAQARELAVHPDELVPVELATVGMSAGTGVPVVLLREPGSGDVVPIFIGAAEARAILMALYEVPVPRPMTHDLLGNVLTALQASLERVIVDDLIDGGYFGMLELRVQDRPGTTLVDTRPSDALALAARVGAGIYVAPKVLRAMPELEFEPLEGQQIVTAIGITVVEATRELREAMQLPPDAGVLVSRTTGAAQEAGLAPGSLILTVNGEPPLSPLDFLHKVRRTPADETARIGYWQEGERLEAQLPTDVPAPATAERGPAHRL